MDEAKRVETLLRKANLCRFWASRANEVFERAKWNLVADSYMSEIRVLSRSEA